jgi:protein-tyrosine phosphatase
MLRALLNANFVTLSIASTTQEEEEAMKSGFLPDRSAEQYRSAIESLSLVNKGSTLIYSDRSTGFKLYLGSIRDALDGDQLYSYNITAILNMAAIVTDKSQDVDFSSHGYSTEFGIPDLSYLSMSIADSPDEDITALFPRALEFIDKAQKQGRHILVHCIEGRNRSTAVVVAWLVQRAKLPLHVALYRVASRRRLRRGGVLTNLGFLNQLVDLQQNHDYH